MLDQAKVVPKEVAKGMGVWSVTWDCWGDGSGAGGIQCPRSLQPVMSDSGGEGDSDGGRLLGQLPPPLPREGTPSLPLPAHQGEELQPFCHLQWHLR